MTASTSQLKRTAVKPRQRHLSNRATRQPVHLADAAAPDRDERLSVVLQPVSWLHQLLRNCTKSAGMGRVSKLQQIS